MTQDFTNWYKDLRVSYIVQGTEFFSGLHTVVGRAPLTLTLTLAEWASKHRCPSLTSIIVTKRGILSIIRYVNVNVHKRQRERYQALYFFCVAGTWGLSAARVGPCPLLFGAASVVAVFEAVLVEHTRRFRFLV